MGGWSVIGARYVGLVFETGRRPECLSQQSETQSGLALANPEGDSNPGNKEVANLLSVSEQQVANYKFDFLARIRTQVKKQGLPEEVFPDLYE